MAAQALLQQQCRRLAPARQLVGAQFLAVGIGQAVEHGRAAVGQGGCLHIGQRQRRASLRGCGCGGLRGRGQRRQAEVIARGLGGGLRQGRAAGQQDQGGGQSSAGHGGLAR